MLTCSGPAANMEADRGSCFRQSGPGGVPRVSVRRILCREVQWQTKHLHFFLTGPLKKCVVLPDISRKLSACKFRHVSYNKVHIFHPCQGDLVKGCNRCYRMLPAPRKKAGLKNQGKVSAVQCEGMLNPKCASCAGYCMQFQIPLLEDVFFYGRVPEHQVGR